MVIGCARTKPRIGPYSEWICAQHWRGVPKDMKRVLFRLHRKQRRYGLSAVLVRAEHRVWKRIVRKAIETAVGL